MMEIEGLSVDGHKTTWCVFLCFMGTDGGGMVIRGEMAVRGWMGDRGGDGAHNLVLECVV